jgi:hypothetical protein
MAVSILECLMNAEHNLQTGIPSVRPMALEQLHNAIVLLEKGYSVETEIDPLIEEYGDVNSVPESA